MRRTRTRSSKPVWKTAWYNGDTAVNYIRPTGHYNLEVFENKKDADKFEKDIIKDMKIEAKKVKPIRGWKL